MHVIASNRPWHRDLAERLGARTGHAFSLVTDPDGLTAEVLEPLEPTYVFLPHWSHRVPAEVHKRYEKVVFHMTDLPFGRGGSPLQNLVARGYEETMVSALRCVDELDAGPVYLKRPVSLLGSAEEVYLRATRVTADMIVEIVTNHPEPTPQSGEATVFRRRRPDESDLAAVTSLDEAYDLIRMLDAQGYPHAFLDVGPLRLTFRRVSRRTDGLHADVRMYVRDDDPDADRQHLPG